MSKSAIAIWAAVAVIWTGIGAFLLWPRDDEDSHASTVAVVREDPKPPRAHSGPDGAPPGVVGAFAVEPSPVEPVEVKLEHPPAAGIMFDVDTGDILWKLGAAKKLPIASLTKMMTALMISERDHFDEGVLISRRAARTPGSKLGVLPEGKKVPLKPLFYGLIMASANDAAVALAEHDAGSVSRFVERMNREAERLGLRCSHFSTPNGLKNRRNHSCALDLAALTRADLSDPRVAAVAHTREISFPFPGKVGTLDLYNNHYFLTRGIAGIPNAEVTGLKTGYTIEAGRCYVTTARLGHRTLGVVLLDSPDPLAQVPELMRAGFGVPEPRKEHAGAD
jgi:serine-type D-Ala-D-Ala carboxypeptidase (penicillin-binding protein 5/6)